MARRTSITHRRIVIPTSLLQTPTRPSFYSGRLLTADDLRQEQEYQRQMRHLHNLTTLGAGVVSGLAVSEGPDGTDVRVTPGYAVDAWGREILVPADVCIPWSTASGRAPRRWGVLIEYAEHETGPVATADGEVATSISEDFTITVITERQGRDDTRVVLRPFGPRGPRKARQTA